MILQTAQQAKQPHGLTKEDISGSGDGEGLLALNCRSDNSWGKQGLAPEVITFLTEYCIIRLQQCTSMVAISTMGVFADCPGVRGAPQHHKGGH